MTQYIDYIKRNSAWIIPLMVAIYMLGFQYEALTFLLFAVVLVCLTIGLSGLAAFAYSKLNFAAEHPLTLGEIFKGVCILIGLATLGFYMAKTIPTQQITDQYNKAIEQYSKPVPQIDTLLIAK